MAEVIAQTIRDARATSNSNADSTYVVTVTRAATVAGVDENTATTSLAGSATPTLIYGTAGDDTYLGSGPVDEIYVGFGGNDFVRGDGGDDRLEGGLGNDRLYGGDGADVLWGGEGSDELYGGAGADTFIYVRGGSNYDVDGIYDFNPAAGDVIRVYGFTSASQYTMAQNGSDVVIRFEGGAAGALVISGMTVEQLVASPGAFRLESGPAPQPTPPPPGSPVTVARDLTVRAGEVVKFDKGLGYVLSEVTIPSPSFHNAGEVDVSGVGRVTGFGHEYTGSFQQSVFVNEATGVFRVTANGENAVAWGFQADSQSADFVNAGWFEVQSSRVAIGVETYDAGSFTFSNTGIFLVSGATNAVGVFMANGGSFNNAGQIEVWSGGQAVGAHLTGFDISFTNSGSILAGTTSATDLSVGVLIEQYGEWELYFKNTGVIAADYAIYVDPTATSNLVSQSVQLLDNSGEIYGAIDLGFGDDVIHNTGLISGPVFLGWGDDVYDGALGVNDGAIYAGQGNDRLIGGAGDDTFLGEEGADLIIGGGGDDVIEGGSGADVLDGGEGWDTASFVNAHGGMTVDLAAGTANGAGQDILRGFEVVIGSTYSDRLTGASGNELLEGGNGDDLLVGGGGDDVLLGDYGADTLTGGAGRDIFMFSLGDGQDVVTDFATGAGGDHLTFHGYKGYVELRQVGADTLVVLSASDTILLKDVQAAALTAADFSFDPNPLPPPPAPDPLGALIVVSDYIVDAGETLDFIGGGPAFFIFDDDPNAPPSVFNFGHIRVTTAPDSTSWPVGFSLESGFGSSSVIYNAAGGVIEVIADRSAAGMNSPGSSPSVYNSGQFSVIANGYALGVATYAGADFAFTNTGSFHVSGAYASGVEMNNGGDFWNSGDILVEGQSAYGGGSATGVLLRGFTYTFVNTGTLRVTSLDRPSVGVSYADYGNFYGEVAKVFINSGLIEADYAIRQDTWSSNEADSVEKVYNSGELRGRVDLGVGRDELYNSGTVTGRIDLAAGDDLYDGRAGSQSGGVFGGDGADVLLAGAGSDRLEGEAGADVLAGGVGADTLVGGSGSDVFRFEAGGGADEIIDFSIAEDRIQSDLAHTLQQQGGDTLVSFADGSTVLLRGVSAASLSAANFQPLAALAATPVFPTIPAAPTAPTVPSTTPPAPQSLVRGGGGADMLNGGAGEHLIEGGGGNDVITGGTDGDRLWGGVGADTFVFRPGDAIVQGAFGAPDVIYDFDPVQGDVIVLDGAGDYTIKRYGVGANDVLVNWNGVALVVRNASVEAVRAAIRVGSPPPAPVAPAAIEGSADHDLLSGTSASEDISGFAGDDVLRGRDGHDRLYGGAGDDVLVGGAGDDRLDGGVGWDAASYEDAASGVTVSLALSGAQATGGAGRDTLVSIEDLVGSSFSDKLTGDANGNILAGENGNDTLFGADGDDWVDGGGGDDILRGGLGADRLIGGAGTDQANYQLATAAVSINLATGVHTGEAAGDTFESIERFVLSRYADQFTGSAGADDVTGDSGNDTLFGGAGNDRLDGGTNNDVLRGGEGADQLIGGTGTDVASYQVATAAVTVNLTTGVHTGEAAGDTFDSIERFALSNFNDTFVGGDGADRVDGWKGNDTLYGGGGNDDLNGYDGNDFLYGGADNDKLRGDRNADELHGDAGADVLYGGTGNDRLFGGDDGDYLWGDEGDDVLTGGAGADRFAFTTGSGFDVVTDFRRGQDKIVLKGIAGVDDFSDLRITTDAHGWAVISWGDGSASIALTGIAAGQLTASDIWFTG